MSRGSAETKKLRQLSRTLSWVLRHGARDAGLSISADGYIPVQDILTCKHPKLSGMKKMTVDDICRVVETNDKKRFKLDQRPANEFYSNANRDDNDDNNCVSDKILCIRANQGHSISGIDANLLLTRLSPEQLASLPTIVHGTYREPWETKIRIEGLKSMNRNHIHFAKGVPQSKDKVISGMRKSCDIYVFVDGKRCAEDGIMFYESDNGVLLTEGIDGTLPCRYFSHATSSSGTVILDQRT